MRLGITNSFSTLYKQKVNTLLNKYEDPKKALDYSSTRQVTQKYRRVTAKKRLEMQKMKLWDNVRISDEQTRCAIRMALAKKTAKTVKQKTDEQEEPVVAK